MLLKKEVFKEKRKDKIILDTKIVVNLKLATAFAYTIKGYLSLSDEILQSIVKDFSYAIDDSKLVSKWNTINIFNKILKNDFDEKLKTICLKQLPLQIIAEITTTKNIIKTLLAYVLLEEGTRLRHLKYAQKK